MSRAPVPGDVYIRWEELMWTVIVMYPAQPFDGEPMWVVMQEDGDVVAYSEYSLVTYYVHTTLF